MQKKEMMYKDNHNHSRSEKGFVLSDTKKNID